MSAGLAFARRVLAASAAAVIVGTASAASAQSNSLEDYANRIKNDFGTIYKTGRLGNDWCFNVETEPGYAWWYYKMAPDTALKARKIRQTARVQATYKVADENFRRYSSIFFGLEIEDALGVPFTAFNLNSFPVKKDAARPTGTQPPPVAPSSDQLQEPANPPSNCKLSEFLPAYFLPYDVTLGNLADSKMDTDSAAYENARYWTFAGRTHAVQNIASHPISIIVNSQPKAVRLIVGFGGGAGP